MSEDRASTTLHVLNKSPQHPRVRECLEQLAGNDGLLLMENAVMMLTTDDWLSNLPRGVALSVLEPDMAMRGITVPTDGITVTDYGGFVRMVCQWPRTIHW